MVFRDKYELLTLHHGDREVIFTGREILSGQAVAVRLLIAGAASESAELMTRLRNLTAEDRGLVLETGDYEGIPFVVTSILPAGLGLHAWLEGAAARLAPGQPPAVPGTLPPGEFTRLFVSPSQSAANTLEAPASAPAPQPGEFTRLFVSPPPVSQEPIPPEPAASAEPGAFTRMLQSPLAAPQAGSGLPTSQPTTGARDAVNGGEFTRMFGQEQTASPAVSAARVEPLPSDGPATGVFAPPQTLEKSTEPGEYTRMFAPPVTPTAPPPLTPVPPAPPPKPVSKPAFPLLPVLAGLAILAVILILVFALTR